MDLIKNKDSYLKADSYNKITSFDSSYEFHLFRALSPPPAHPEITVKLIANVSI